MVKPMEMPFGLWRRNGRANFGGWGCPRPSACMCERAERVINTGTTAQQAKVVCPCVVKKDDELRTGYRNVWSMK